MNLFTIPPRPELQKQWEMTTTRMQEWLHGELFTPRWFLMLALLAITLTLWWRLVDKSRLGEITLYTLIIILFIIVLDELGEELSLWYYPVDLFFIFPPTTAINISCMPLIYMLVYQRYSTWRGFVIATVVMSLVFCFFFEPVAVRIGIYVMLKWKSWYGLPIYAFIAFAGKFIVDRLIAARQPKS